VSLSGLVDPALSGKRNDRPGTLYGTSAPFASDVRKSLMVGLDTPASHPESQPLDGSRSRPLRADARRNRDRVLEAARAAFAAGGLDASLDEIARRAGVGAGTVYRHFPTKEALFEAVVLERIEELIEEGRARADDPDPGRAFSSFVELLAREGALKRDLVETLSSDGIRLQFGESPIVDGLMEVLGDLLSRAQRASAVRRDIGVTDVMALLTGAAYAICHSHADDEQSRRLLAIMYDGLRSDRPAEER
jgi:AcrR family transcriptional regulator